MKEEYRYVITDGETFASDANATHFTKCKHNAFTWSSLTSAENVLANRGDSKYEVSVIRHYQVNVDPDIAMDIDVIQQFIDIVQDALDRYDTLVQLEKDVDNQQLDIEHYIEDTNFSACTGFNLAKRLQEIRRKRRLIKQRIKIMEFIRNSGVDVEPLKTIVKNFTDVKYKPRYYDDLDDILK